MQIYIYLLLFLASFLPTYFAMPFFIRRMHARGLTGKDMNKNSKIEVAELGGMVVWLGFSSSIILAIFLSNYLFLLPLDMTLLLAGYATISMVFFLGVIDDLVGWRKGIRQWQHALFPLFAALPLMAIKITNPPMVLPIIGLLPNEFLIPYLGVVSFGLIYSLFIVPIGITGASNATNMLAGLNGLEAGLGLTILSFLFAIVFLQQVPTAAAISIAMMGSLLAFLVFNKCPAKVFGGDSLTLSIGATIATIAILANIEKLAVLMMLLYFIELYMKQKHKFQLSSFGLPQKDNTLKPPEIKSSFTHLIMSLGKYTESQITKIIISLQFIICLIVFLLYYFNMVF